MGLRTTRTQIAHGVANRDQETIRMQIVAQTTRMQIDCRTDQDEEGPADAEDPARRVFRLTCERGSDGKV